MKLESNRIKELRTKHHITIIKLAECIGTSVSTLIAWEKASKDLMNYIKRKWLECLEYRHDI